MLIHIIYSVYVRVRASFNENLFKTKWFWFSGKDINKLYKIRIEEHIWKKFNICHRRRMKTFACHRDRAFHLTSKQLQERETVGENGECIVHFSRWWWTVRSPPSVRRASDVGSTAARNDLLISTASQWRIGQLQPRIQPQSAKSAPRGLSQREGCKPHGVSSEGLGRDVVAYLILGNYSGTMKGGGSSVFCLRRPLLPVREIRW